jgi:hypothetical protein
MEQAVMVFATSTARTTALAAPSEGMITFLKDNNKLEYYDGSAWQPMLDQDVIAAKGDLIVGTGDDAVARLAVGTNGYVLTADSAEATGLKWAAAGGAGKVLQVVQAEYSTEVVVASTSYTDTGLSVTITPTAATSKILILVAQPMYSSRSGQDTGGAIRILRDSTTIFTLADSSASLAGFIQVTGQTVQLGINVPLIYLDSPNTTSAITYKTQGRTRSTANSGQSIFQGGSIPSVITVLEIGA